MTALTIGMAHHTDYEGAYFSIQSLKMHHKDIIDQVELVVVDNSPGTPDSQLLSKLMTNWVPGGRHTFANVQYIPSQEIVGTSATRHHIFNVAQGDAVLVMDCHVLFPPGALARLLRFYDQHPDTGDIYNGPLLFDDLETITTHFNDVWRTEMWGIWGKAWRCNCGPEGVHFTPVQEDEKQNFISFRSLELQTPIRSCHHCGRPLPEGPWNGHEQGLTQMGYHPLGVDDDDEPFAVPGCGLGVFTCRKDAWLGFNEHARGFGGEELYIHEKYRQHGHQAVCLPFLKWLHRFARPRGVPYPLTQWNKVRNYVLEFNELGMELEPIRAHFVDTQGMKADDWERLVADPIAAQEGPEDEGCGGCKSEKALTKQRTLDDLFDAMRAVKRDLDQHMPQLKELAGKVNRVTEFTKRKESTVAFAAARPEQLRSYQLEQHGTLNRTVTWLKEEGVDVQVLNQPSMVTDDIEETDLLFIDSQHTAARLMEELNKFAPKVSRFIVMHDTKLHGEQGEDGGPGLLHALREFMKANPQWSVVDHTDKQYGLTVISCQDQDKPPLPSTWKVASNFAQAMANYAGDGLRNVTPENLEARLARCSICPQRRDNRCAACGCFLDKKAAIRSSVCPLGYWGEVDRLVQLQEGGDDNEQSE